MFKSLTLKTLLGFGTVLAALGGTTQAAMVYSDVAGDTVSLTSIYESSPTGDSSPLYGQPIASGDSFDFAPTGGFSAQSADGGGTDTTDGKLSIVITAKPGYAINTFEVLESGIASLFSFGTGDAFASVEGIVDIDINEIDGSAVAIELPISLMSFSPYSGEYQHSVLATGASYNTAWTGGITVDIAAAVASYSPVLGATKLTVTLDNILLASTLGDGTSALIDKKDYDIIISTDGSTPAVPEPSAVLLLVLGSTAMLARRRR